MIESKYVFEIYNDQGELLADLSGIASMRQLEKARNRAGSCRFSVDLDVIEQYCEVLGMNPNNLFEINKNEVLVRIGTTYIFGGQITDTNVRLGFPPSLEVSVIGFFDLLKDRYLDQDTMYEDADAGEIAWDLIDGTQSTLYGNFGILRGAIQPSVVRNFKFVIDKNIRDAIIELSSFREGFDFEVTPHKEFVVYYPQQGVKRPNATFIRSDETGKGNIVDGNIARTGSQITNSVLARGEGFGDAQLRRSATDANSMNAYKRRERIVDHPSVVRGDTLTEHAQSEVDEFANAIVIPDIIVDGSKRPYLDEYGIGDLIRIKLEKYKIAQDLHKDYYRIDAISVSVDDNDFESIKLTLSKPNVT